MAQAAPSPRRRDAAASRDRLLTAASELFDDRGYDQTTARDIGERANVDPTMIARYFGGKAQLFIAVLHREDTAEQPADLLDPERLESIVERIGRRGPGPVVQAAIRPYDNPDAQTAALAELDHRILAPLRARFAAQGDEQAALRAELVTAAFIGVILGRHARTLPHLSSVSAPDLLALLENLLDTH
ncbi:MAG TPA: TetR family transcriptional regulator [Pseudonocardiaceae bacterium]|jgi:AcrR family transcriptional regulator|nr:TetR family transcriptional regulator [Pseudonocardiaceae bacterium]